MAGGHGHGQGVSHGGLTLHTPKRWHTVVGTGMASIMWYFSTEVLVLAPTHVDLVTGSRRVIILSAADVAHIAEWSICTIVILSRLRV